MVLTRLIRDVPCPRLAVVLTLTLSGALGGAFQGLLSADVLPKGDASVWDRIEDCTGFCAAAGLAAGVSLALVRHVAARFLVALLFGTLSESLRLLAAYPDLFFSSDVGWDLIGSPLFLGAPVAATIALSAHAVRVLSGSIRGVLSSLILCGVLGIQSTSVWDAYGIARSLKNPWMNLVDYNRLVPTLWKGGLLLGLCVAVSMCSLELLCIVLRSRGAGRWSGVWVAAAGLFLLATGIGLRTWMPFTPASPVCGLAFSGDGRRLVTAHEGRTLRLWSFEESDPDKGPRARELAKVRLPFRPGDRTSLAGDGSRILVASQSGRILLRKASTLAPLDEVEYPDQNFHAPALSGDGRFLSVLHGSDEIWLWPSEDRERPLQEPPLVLRTDGLSFIAASFSSDGGFLLAQDREGDSMLWDAATGDRCWRRGDLDSEYSDQELGALFGPRPFRLDTSGSRVTSPDGRHFATVINNNIQVWGDDDVGPLLIFQGLGAGIGALGYSPDGHYLVAGNEQGQVRLLLSPTK